MAAGGDEAQAVEDFAIQPEQVPAQGAAQPHCAVGETMHFLQRHALSIERAKHHTTALRAEVAGDVMAGSGWHGVGDKFPTAAA